VPRQNPSRREDCMQVTLPVGECTFAGGGVNRKCYVPLLTGEWTLFRGRGGEGIVKAGLPNKQHHGSAG